MKTKKSKSQVKKTAKQKVVKVKDWNNGTIWKLEAKIQSLANFDRLNKLACAENYSGLMATAQALYDYVSNFADVVLDASEARAAGILTPIE